MNREIFLAALEQRLKSPVRLALAIAIMLFAAMPYLVALLFHQTTGVLPTSHGWQLALVFAAGVIGQEFSSGAPQVTFTRPLKRWTWVLSRGAAVAALAALCALPPFAAALAATHAPGDVALAALEQVLAAVGTTAVLIGLSAMVPGLTDLALLAGANIGLGIVGIVAQVAQNDALRQAAAWLKDHASPWFAPTLEVVPVLHGGVVSPHAVLVYASTILFWFVVGCALVDRKELSYATD